VQVKDGVIEKIDPEETIGFVSVPFTKWMQDIPYA